MKSPHCLTTLRAFFVYTELSLTNLDLYSRPHPAIPCWRTAFGSNAQQTQTERTPDAHGTHSSCGFAVRLVFNCSVLDLCLSLAQLSTSATLIGNKPKIQLQ